MARRLTLRRGLAASVVVTSLLLFGLTPASAQQLTKVKVGILPISSLVPFFTAVEKGYFKEEGLEIETETLGGGAAILPAISGGSIDIGFSNVISIILASARGFDFRIIAHNNSVKSAKMGDPAGYITSSTGLFVLATSNINQAKDLEGKTIAVNTLNNIDWVATYEWLERRGADPRTVTWLELDFPKMPPALFGQKVDAIKVADPFSTILKEGGKTRILDYPLEALRPNLVLASWVTSESWIKRHPGVAEKFARALSKGMEYLAPNTEEKIRMLTKHTRVTSDVARKMQWDTWTTKMDVESLQFWSDLATKRGLLKERVDVSKLIHETAR